MPRKIQMKKLASFIISVSLVLLFVSSTYMDAFGHAWFPDRERKSPRRYLRR